VQDFFCSCSIWCLEAFEKRVWHRCSVSLLMTWCHQVAQICTYFSKKNSRDDTLCPINSYFTSKMHQIADLHLRSFKNFPGVIPPEPHNCGAALPTLLLSACVHHPTFRSFTSLAVSTITISVTFVSCLPSDSCCCEVLEVVGARLDSLSVYQPSASKHWPVV